MRQREKDSKHGAKNSKYRSKRKGNTALPIQKVSKDRYHRGFVEAIVFFFPQ